MKITVNSKETEIADNMAISQLKNHLGLPVSGTAVAVNGRVIPSPQHSAYELREGDDVVVIGAAYGG